MLAEIEKEQIIELIRDGKKLPKEVIYKLFEDEEDVFLFWNGRKEEVTNIALPFHSIEHIDEPRKESESEQKQEDIFETDKRGRQLKGWTNKLIWGDNKLILSSLAHGPMREEIEKEGGIKLIYIDPPFAVGADFGFTIDIAGESAEKKQSVIEEIAYRDTWGKGISSYLSMMFERLKVINDLLSKNGSIYIHCDNRVSAFLRVILDDVFGRSNFINEIIWKRADNHNDGNKFGVVDDRILYYSKNFEDRIFCKPYADYSEEYIDNFYNKTDETGRVYRLDHFTKPKGSRGYFYDYKTATPPPNGWRCPIETMKSFDEQGLLVFLGNKVYKKRYLDEQSGNPVHTIWDDITGQLGKQSVDYPTQKPEALLERIIKASSNEGDLIADFFCGSGTTAAVAEKLKRKWIVTDLGRFAIHTTRKRMIGVQRELKTAGKDFRAFELLNLGKYERQFFIDDLTSGNRSAKEERYIELILEAYKAKRIHGHKNLHGSKSGRFINIGPLDVPVTQSRIQEIFEECREKLYTQVDVLGFEFEMGLTPQFIQELKEKGVVVTLKYIPKDVFDKRAVEKGQVRFYDVAYLKTKETVKGRKVSIELIDFVTHYTQDDIEEIQQSMRSGSRVVIDDGQIVKIEKDKNGIITRTILTEKWYDWIDYWAIDFNYEDKKEIIKIKNEDGTTSEIWSGNYLFENEWQSFRTKKNPKLEFTSIAHEYSSTGRYKVMVKVVDILGIDTSKIIEVVVK
ncbi:MAG: hypothetical protein FMNOHCHN_01687 [Ignavibacteriaceae bacterium]|nr:hypothetical protein [Ignavibacteriaceae bacterium]